MTNEKQLIDANDAFEIVTDLAGRADTKGAYKAFWEAARAIQKMPTVDAVEVVHGQWVLGKVEPGYFAPGGNRPWVCSECDEVISYRLDKPMENYCPNCGAKMDGGNEDGKS